MNSFFIICIFAILEAISATTYPQTLDTNGTNYKSTHLSIKNSKCKRQRTEAHIKRQHAKIALRNELLNRLLEIYRRQVNPLAKKIPTGLLRIRNVPFFVQVTNPRYWSLSQMFTIQKFLPVIQFESIKPSLQIWHMKLLQVEEKLLNVYRKQVNKNAVRIPWKHVRILNFPFGLEAKRPPHTWLLSDMEAIESCLDKIKFELAWQAEVESKQNCKMEDFNGNSSSLDDSTFDEESLDFSLFEVFLKEYGSVVTQKDQVKEFKVIYDLDSASDVFEDDYQNFDDKEILNPPDFELQDFEVGPFENANNEILQNEPLNNTKISEISEGEFEVDPDLLAAYNSFVPVQYKVDFLRSRLAEMCEKDTGLELKTSRICWTKVDVIGWPKELDRSNISKFKRDQCDLLLMHMKNIRFKLKK